MRITSLTAEARHGRGQGGVDGASRRGLLRGVLGQDHGGAPLLGSMLDRNVDTSIMLHELQPVKHFVGELWPS